ncbi:signal integration modulator SinM [Pyxidicoccus xibeiensis]|uniref:signal integration modulator SinM n=1 Tax=Pyxidicoccus xibeiensis TaxID=2906759 RepID=UPI0020A7ECA2|nr:signal integration modulator SinM [Pyxidicoccus xibeiensis]MCP3137451.1 signal integration modulator SinM [Pyxidicoccus xibeiensis]
MKLARLSVLLFAVACSSESPPVDPGQPDAGGTEDSGTGGDDAGPTDDGGTEPDGGAEPIDAGTDAGEPVPDAGTDAGTDGGTCVAPALEQGTELAARLNTPRRLAVYATDIYISESHSLDPQQEDPGPGRVLRLSRAGGDAVPLVTGLRAPDALAVDATSVYVLDLGGLWRVDKATGRKDERALDTTFSNVTFGNTEVLTAQLNGRDVLVVSTGHRRLVRVDTNGGNRQELFLGAANNQVRGARVSGTDVWFLVANGTSPGLYSVPLDGSAAATLRDDSVTAGTSLELTPTHFLITDGGGGAGRVVRLPRSGGPAEVVASGLQGPRFPVELNGSLYFKDATDVGANFLRQVRACAPGTSDPVGPAGTGPGALLLDGTSLLYTSQESGTGGSVGRVP